MKSFSSSDSALSVMYDALLFIVLISLCGVVLLPALHSPLLTDHEIESYKENRAEFVLDSLLFSKVSSCDYMVAGDLLQSGSQNLSINMSEGSVLYELVARVFERNCKHLTCAELVSAVLGSQWKVPIGSSLSLNVLTSDFEDQLIKDVEMFLNESLPSRYNYYFSSSWRPLSGVDFGGWFECGSAPPSGVDVFVAKRSISMPFSPLVVSVGNASFVLNEGFFKNIFKNNSEILIINDIFESYSLLLNDSEQARSSLIENCSFLFSGLLFEGIYKEDGQLVVKPIVGHLIDSMFSRFELFCDSLITQYSEEVLNAAVGASFGSIDSVFEGLTMGGSDSEIIDFFVNQMSDYVGEVIDVELENSSSFFEHLEQMIFSNISTLLQPTINNSVESLVDACIAGNTSDISFFIDAIIDFFADLVSFSDAQVVLMIWSWGDLD